MNVGMILGVAQVGLKVANTVTRLVRGSERKVTPEQVEKVNKELRKSTRMIDNIAKGRSVDE